MNSSPLSSDERINSEEKLEERLSRPTEADIEAMRALDGDLLILGVSGKMGPSLARLAKRACDAAGAKRRIIGVSRFSTGSGRAEIEAIGIELIACDLLDSNAVASLPACENVLSMTGHKFGTAQNQSITWATNAFMPGVIAERFAASRIVAFSSGNVYPLTAVSSGGPTENDPTGPVGEYAQSALARERVLTYFSERNQTPIVILRLNYAIDLRYGVLRDIADKVFERRPVDLNMGYANVIWQRDANSVALRSFAHAASPPLVLNLTGAETISVRETALRFGQALGIEPVFEGVEKDTALLNNAGKCLEMFGPPSVDLERMIEWIAGWVGQGGASLGKPTHFEEREGKF